MWVDPHYRLLIFFLTIQLNFTLSRDKFHKPFSVTPHSTNIMYMLSNEIDNSLALVKIRTVT